MEGFTRSRMQRLEKEGKNPLEESIAVRATFEEKRYEILKDMRSS